MADNTAAERHVIEIATRLFGELGFDGTSMRLIADAAGLDLDTVVAVAGDKVELYREVMRRAHEVEQAAMGEALARFTPTRDGLIALADAYLDFCVGHPQIVALWLHRWMGDAADVTDLEERYSRALTARVTSVIRPLLPPDVDADHVAWMIVWSVYGFMSGRLQYTVTNAPARASRRRGIGVEPAALARFRDYLHKFIWRMTSPTVS
ncbi:TetR/AcrR family transcriptional regulator [Thermoactinospora rubra]|uniref:TetR/AcrR family transcriptional regulator n=1 Tax=Thermoactinospora rubra TaxID=1088767 RepID=UPI000A11A407|nr:TetR/AcrR family transcriptional regulator [Thermoactinospora rubra]